LFEFVEIKICYENLCCLGQCYTCNGVDPEGRGQVPQEYGGAKVSVCCVRASYCGTMLYTVIHVKKNDPVLVHNLLTLIFHKARLRCDGIFNDQFLTQSLLSPMVKNFENWSTFAEVMSNVHGRFLFLQHCVIAFSSESDMFR